ncbi:NUDIX hydrolase domain-like protein [Infundibulicybe gibba]|nr:NUDIX hydrolase domain-like protein [Infundibulicybe gibba]
MFGGSPLNRLSWLRTSHVFLNSVVVLPATRWVKPLIGSEPYFGQGKEPGSTVSSEVADSTTESARIHGSPLVFLGVRESDPTGNALPSSEFKDPQTAIANLQGTPYFSMDVADLGLPDERLEEIIGAIASGQEGRKLTWSEPRALMTGLDAFSGAIFAEGRSLVDWNTRNKFCPACGSQAYSMWGGWKIACLSILPWAEKGNKKPCFTSKGLHNFTHPRTDPVVIMIAVDETGEKILLGRGKRFPGKFYSALAGFIEPGESFEDAVAREMWEEAGPYPSSLMVGFYARADSTKPIRTNLDNELVDAGWYTRAEVLHVLGHPTGVGLPAADAKEGEGIAEPPFRVPPATAIAGVLIRDWAEGKIGFAPDSGNAIQERVLKGNL